MIAPTLREAVPADAVALGDVHVASWRETYAGLLPDAMLALLSVEARVAMWASVLGDPSASGTVSVIVAEAEDRIVGFGACGRQRDAALAGQGFDGEIGAIYLLRAYQGTGAGRALMGELARALTGAGQSAVSLWVLRENAQARGFYEALGGEVLDERVDDGPDGAIVEVAYGWRDLSRLSG